MRCDMIGAARGGAHFSALCFSSLTNHHPAPTLQVILPSLLTPLLSQSSGDSCRGKPRSPDRGFPFSAADRRVRGARGGGAITVNRR